MTTYGRDEFCKRLPEILELELDGPEALGIGILVKTNVREPRSTNHRSCSLLFRLRKKEAAGGTCDHPTE